MVDDEVAWWLMCCPVVAIPREGWWSQQPKGQQHRWTTAKATNVDAGILGHHKHIEVARVLCEITRTRTLAPKIATRRMQVSIITKTLLCQGSSQHGLCGEVLGVKTGSGKYRFGQGQAL